MTSVHFLTDCEIDFEWKVVNYGNFRFLKSYVVKKWFWCLFCFRVYEWNSFDSISFGMWKLIYEYWRFHIWNGYEVLSWKFVKFCLWIDFGEHPGFECSNRITISFGRFRCDLRHMRGFGWIFKGPKLVLTFLDVMLFNVTFTRFVPRRPQIRVWIVPLSLEHQVNQAM